MNRRIFDLDPNSSHHSNWCHLTEDRVDRVPDLVVEVEADTSRFDDAIRQAIQATARVAEEWRQTLTGPQRLVAEMWYEMWSNLLLYGQTTLPNGTVIIIGADGSTGVWQSFGLDNLTEHEGFHGVQVQLDECWRCQTTIPKDDEFGMCEPCKVAMQHFVDEPTPVNPIYAQEWGNDLGSLPIDGVVYYDPVPSEFESVNTRIDRRGFYDSSTSEFESANWRIDRRSDDG